MAYVAMNLRTYRCSPSDQFLNGVCRHELSITEGDWLVVFLNGVCRHEPAKEVKMAFELFLNGVCRHELFLQVECRL